MRRIALFLALVTVSVAQDKLILNAQPPPIRKPPKQPSCAVQELYAIAWSTHNPAERHKAMLDWLGQAMIIVITAIFAGKTAERIVDIRTNKGALDGT